MSVHLFLAAPGGEMRDPGIWTAALREEWRIRTEAPHGAPSAWRGGGAGPLRSVFLEAGAAPVLGASLADRVREVLPPEALASVREWTVEVDTPGVPASWLERWAQGGVTRLSLRGAAAALAEGGLEAVARTRTRAGLELELGVEVPLVQGGGGAREAGNHVRAAAAAGATSVALAEAGGSGLDAEAGPWEAAMEAADALGWEVPELSLAHRPGHPPHYALALALRAPVLGLGPGAISFRHPVREWNHPGWRPYLASIQRGERPRARHELLSREAARLERIWMGLRRARGLRLPGPGTGADLLDSWRTAGWIRSPRDADPASPRPGPARRVRLSRAGWLQVDRLAVEISARLDP